MSDTFTFDAAEPVSGQATARVTNARLPITEKRYLGIILNGTKPIIKVLDGGGMFEEDAYSFEVVIERDAESDEPITDLREASAEWFALVGSYGDVSITQADWAETYDNMLLYRVEPSGTLNDGAAAVLQLSFARFW